MPSALRQRFILDAISVISLLLDAGADIDARTTDSHDGDHIAGETALSYAIDWFHLTDLSRKRTRIGLSAPAPWSETGRLLGGRSAEDCLRHVEDPMHFRTRTKYSDRKTTDQN